MALGEREMDGYALEGMARALWVHAYMLWALEVEPPPDLGTRPWDELAPNNDSTRRASMAAAKELEGLLGAENDLGRYPLAKIFRRATGEDAKDYGVGTVLYAFGEDVAHVCMGTRDHQDSAVPFAEGLVIPHFSVELSDDGTQLSWDGGWTWNGSHCNPCRRNGDEPEVLVIEDDESLQKMYPRIIRRVLPTAKIHIVDNYTAALGYLETRDIKLVISDVDLVGHRTGVDVFEWVRQHQPHLVDRYVFVTGGNPHVQQIHRLYLEKPAEPDELREMIRTMAASAPAAPAKSRTRTRTSAPPATRRATQSPPIRTASKTAPPARPVTIMAPPSSSAMSTEAFARAVNEAMSTIRAEPSPLRPGVTVGRFGPDKVFVSAIWRTLSADPRFHQMTHQQFLRHLLDANRHGYIALARADMPGAMDPTEVTDSEIRDMGSTFHFVVDRSAAPYGTRW